MRKFIDFMASDDLETKNRMVEALRLTEPNPSRLLRFVNQGGLMKLVPQRQWQILLGMDQNPRGWWFSILSRVGKNSSIRVYGGYIIYLYQLIELMGIINQLQPAYNLGGYHPAFQLAFWCTDCLARSFGWSEPWRSLPGKRCITSSSMH